MKLEKNQATPKLSIGQEVEVRRWVGLVYYLFEILLVELVGNPDGSEDGDEEKGEWEYECE